MALPKESYPWQMLLQSPVCGDLEGRYCNVFGLENKKGDGTYFSEKGVLAARLCRGNVSGMEKWGGPAAIENAVILVKNPRRVRSLTSDLSIGSSNALFEYGGYVFAAIVSLASGLVTARPVDSEHQEKFTLAMGKDLDRVLSPLPFFKG